MEFENMKSYHSIISFKEVSWCWNLSCILGEIYTLTVIGGHLLFVYLSNS
jgi:hypothetical protein